MKSVLFTLLAGSLAALPAGGNQAAGELNRRLFSLDSLRQLAQNHPGLIKYNQPETNSVTINYTPQSGQTTTYTRTVNNPGSDFSGNTPPATVTENYWTTPPNKDGQSTVYWNGQPVANGQFPGAGGAFPQFWNPYFDFGAQAQVKPQVQPRSNVDADADAKAN